MKRTIQVYLGNDALRVWTLHFDAVGSRQHSAFAYEDSWLKAANRFALEPGLPLVAGPKYHRKTQGWVVEFRWTFGEEWSRVRAPHVRSAFRHRNSPQLRLSNVAGRGDAGDFRGREDRDGGSKRLRQDVAAEDFEWDDGGGQR